MASRYGPHASYCGRVERWQWTSMALVMWSGLEREMTCGAPRPEDQEIARGDLSSRRGLTPSGRLVLGQVLVRLAGSAHPAPPDVPLAVAPEEPGDHGGAAADGAGAALRARRDRLGEVG